MSVNPKKCTTQSNRGVALLTVMLVVALATTTAIAMASRQQLDIRRTENTLYQGQALMYLYGAEIFAHQFLAEDRRDNQIDHDDEDWAKAEDYIDFIPVEGGSITGHIKDLHGRFNLNNLTQPAPAGTVARDRFERLLRQLDISPDIISTIQDWLDKDINQSFPAGAEDDYYLGQEPAYRTANQNMWSSSELLLLKDLEKETFEKLRPYIIALPVVTPININTASIDVLMSLEDNLSKTDIESLISKRPFNDVTDFLADNAFAGKNVPPDGLSVSSDYFLIYAQANIGHLQQTLTSIVERDANGGIQILVRSESEL